MKLILAGTLLYLAGTAYAATCECVGSAPNWNGWVTAFCCGDRGAIEYTDGVKRTGEMDNKANTCAFQETIGGKYTPVRPIPQEFKGCCEMIAGKSLRVTGECK